VASVRVISEDEPLPPMMRVGVLHEPGVFKVENRPVPQPKANEVLVEVRSVGVCGSDVHYYRHGRIAHHVVRQPLVLGHEAGGRVVAVGRDVDPGRLGERVAIEPGVPCRLCDHCKSGSYNLCRDMAFFATPPVDGAFAQFVAIAADFAHPVPATVSDDAAALMEPLSVALWACTKAAVGPASRVLIAGAGPIGLLNLQVALARGATQVTVSDIVPARLDAAKRFGATQVIDARGQRLDALGLEVDSFIECSGAETAVQQGARVVRAGGVIVLIGMGRDEVLLPVGVIQVREITLTGTCRYANTYPTAVALVAKGLVDLDNMVTERFGLDQAEVALNQGSNPEALKAIVEPWR
jgi:L-iditol 2-dehydrogenase